MCFNMLQHIRASLDHKSVLHRSSTSRDLAFASQLCPPQVPMASGRPWAWRAPEFGVDPFWCNSNVSSRLLAVSFITLVHMVKKKCWTRDSGHTQEAPTGDARTITNSNSKLLLLLSLRGWLLERGNVMGIDEAHRNWLFHVVLVFSTNEPIEIYQDVPRPGPSNRSPLATFKSLLKQPQNLLEAGGC